MCVRERNRKHNNPMQLSILEKPYQDQLFCHYVNDDSITFEFNYNTDFWPLEKTMELMKSFCTKILLRSGKSITSLFAYSTVSL